ncbi:MAG: hypothetical protein INQ03_08855 [Candidatus Heimdallarchaeota archaeon]|nr:hypothetical protein [Candidatus Heimdallarchaeota archaeon]
MEVEEGGLTYQGRNRIRDIAIFEDRYALLSEYGYFEIFNSSNDDLLHRSQLSDSIETIVKYNNQLIAGIEQRGFYIFNHTDFLWNRIDLLAMDNNASKVDCVNCAVVDMKITDDVMRMIYGDRLLFIDMIKMRIFENFVLLTDERPIEIVQSKTDMMIIYEDSATYTIISYGILEHSISPDKQRIISAYLFDGGILISTIEGLFLIDNNKKMHLELDGTIYGFYYDNNDYYGVKLSNSNIIIQKIDLNTFTKIPIPCWIRLGIVLISILLISIIVFLRYRNMILLKIDGIKKKKLMKGAGFNDLSEYQDALNRGFNSKLLYDKARAMGLNSYKAYLSKIGSEVRINKTEEFPLEEISKEVDLRISKFTVNLELIVPLILLIGLGILYIGRLLFLFISIVIFLFLLISSIKAMGASKPIFYKGLIMIFIIILYHYGYNWDPSVVILTEEGDINNLTIIGENLYITTNNNKSVVEYNHNLESTKELIDYSIIDYDKNHEDYYFLTNLGIYNGSEYIVNITGQNNIKIFDNYIFTWNETAVVKSNYSNILNVKSQFPLSDNILCKNCEIVELGYLSGDILVILDSGVIYYLNETLGIKETKYVDEPNKSLKFGFIENEMVVLVYTGGYIKLIKEGFENDIQIDTAVKNVVFRNSNLILLSSDDRIHKMKIESGEFIIQGSDSVNNPVFLEIWSDYIIISNDRNQILKIHLQMNVYDYILTAKLLSILYGIIILLIIFYSINKRYAFNLMSK